MELSVRAVATLLAAALLGFGITVTAMPAVSAAGACATRTEYSRVENGMTFERVKRIFGGAPNTKQDNGAGYMAAGWKKCGTRVQEAGYMMGACITFERGRVWLKDWSNEFTWCLAPGGPSRPPTH